MDTQSCKQYEYIYKEDTHIGEIREWFNESRDQFLHTRNDIDRF